jgi:hypothetical protein
MRLLFFAFSVQSRESTPTYARESLTTDRQLLQGGRARTVRATDRAAI